jgi:low temperature requirement protein LtrA
MQRSEVFQALTLWFVVAIFFKVESGGSDGPLVTLLALVGVAVLYLTPVYLAVGVAAELFGD